MNTTFKIAVLLIFTSSIHKAAENSRYLPHLTRSSGGFSTEISVANKGDEKVQVELVGYDHDGTPVDTAQILIEGNQVIAKDARQWFSQDVSHVEIGGSPEAVVQVAYRATAGLSSPANVRETDEVSKRFRIFPGDWSLVFDGLAYVNSGNQPARVVLVQYDYNHQLIAEIELQSIFPAKAKGLYVIGGPQGSVFSSEIPTYFELISTEPLAITSLRGTPPGSTIGLLWENLAETFEFKLLEPVHISDVQFWAYQIQDVNLNQSVDQLIQSKYDLIVVEPTRTDWSNPTDPQGPYARDFNTADMVSRLKASPSHDGIHRKRVVAYIDIGQAEDWRWYWNWDDRSPDDDVAIDLCNQPSFPPSNWPDFILLCDPDWWLHNYPVKYWDAEWQNIVIEGEGLSSQPHGDYVSILDEVLIDGFDGIYLDWVEAFEHEPIRLSAEQDGLNALSAMVQFIERMATYTRERHPNFTIIQQNGASLILNPEIAGLIDAIAQEAIWFDGRATDTWDDPNGQDFRNDQGLVDYYLHYLGQYRELGIPILNCEYALDHAEEAYQLAIKEGYIPYVTRRSLGRLSTTPPPGL